MSIPQRIADNRSSLSSIFEHFSISINDQNKVIHLGKRGELIARPIKIIYGNRDAASSIIKDFHSKIKSCIKTRARVHVVRDKPITERELLRATHKALELRTQEVHSNLTISYFKGIPRVVHFNSKNYVHHINQQQEYNRVEYTRIHNFKSRFACLL